MTSVTEIKKNDPEQYSGQFATFFVADLFFGLDVLRVQEVLRFQQMTRVPQAPDVIEGLINLRGQIVTAIDMRRRLGLPTRAGGDRTRENEAPPPNGDLAHRNSPSVGLAEKPRAVSGAGPFAEPCERQPSRRR